MTKLNSIIQLVLYAVLFSVLAEVLPWMVFIPAAVLAAAVHLYIVTRQKKSRYLSLMNHVRNIQSDSLPAMKSPGWRDDIDAKIYEAFKEIAAELEKKCYQLIEKNIQLLSLKELGLTIISSLDEKKVVDSVKNFLSKGLAFKEYFIAIFAADKKVFNIYRYRNAFGRIEQTNETFELNSIEGLLKKTIVSTRSLLIRDPSMHPLGSLHGSQIFDKSTMSSYVLVPMIRSVSAMDCKKSDECLLTDANSEAENDFILEGTVCPACKIFPVLGVIGVTDGFKSETLSQVDLVSIETLSLQVGTILENTILYDELRREEVFRDDVINSMMSGLVTTDGGGRIMLANQAAEKMSGYSSGELEGKYLKKLLTRGRNSGDDPVEHALKRGRSTFQKEAWLAKKNGSKLPLVLNISFLPAEENKAPGIIAVFYDMTQIKLMEKKISHLDKLAALGRLSSSIAHEIRNPLTGIAAGIQYLDRVKDFSDEDKKNVSFILSEVERINRLIGDLMSIVKVGDLLYQDTALETIINNSVASLQKFITMKQITVSTIFPKEKRTVDVDPDRIAQVMINLIKNAIEASSVGGEISIEISFSSRNRDVLFDGAGGYAIIKISDFGSGLAPDEKEKIFEPFFSTKTEGVGLGLYVAYNFVERHGGSIHVDSEAGKGTTFSVYIPVEREQHGEANKISNTPG